MSNSAPKSPPSSAGPQIHKVVLEDLRSGDLRRSLRRDFRELYDFYIDEEKRTRLAAMGRVQRWFFVAWWLVRGMILKLTPVRRLMLLLAFVLLIIGPDLLLRTGRQPDGEGLFFSVNFPSIAFVLVFVILMLELKDKLLAHDELKAGRVVQLALLPTEQPRLSGWTVELFTRPANDVGGDLVDHMGVRDGRLGVVLADVAGKGLAAALLMAKLQATVRALAPEPESLAELAARVNRIIHRDGLSNRFATLIYFELSPDSGLVRMVNAGHIPPVVLRHAGVEKLGPTSLPLGIRDDENFVEQRLELAPGEALLAFSDGLTEARNAAGEFFGERKLDEAFPLLRGLAPDAVARWLVAEVERFAGERRLDDDLSLVVLRRSN